MKTVKEEDKGEVVLQSALLLPATTWMILLGCWKRSWRVVGRRHARDLDWTTGVCHNVIGVGSSIVLHHDETAA